MAINTPQQPKSASKQLLPMVGSLVGSYFGPAGKAIGGAVGGMAASSGEGGGGGTSALSGLTNIFSQSAQKPQEQAPKQQNSSIPSDREAMQMSLNNRMTSMREKSPDLQVLEAQKALSTLPPEQRAEYEPYFNQYAELKKRERVRGF